MVRRFISEGVTPDRGDGSRTMTPRLPTSGTRLQDFFIESYFMIDGFTENNLIRQDFD